MIILIAGDETRHDWLPIAGAWRVSYLPYEPPRGRTKASPASKVDLLRPGPHDLMLLAQELKGVRGSRSTMPVWNLRDGGSGETLTSEEAETISDGLVDLIRMRMRTNNERPEAIIIDDVSDWMHAMVLGHRDPDSRVQKAIREGRIGETLWHLSRSRSESLPVLLIGSVVTRNDADGKYVGVVPAVLESDTVVERVADLVIIVRGGQGTVYASRISYEVGKPISPVDLLDDYSLPHNRRQHEEALHV